MSKNTKNDNKSEKQSVKIKETMSTVEKRDLEVSKNVNENKNQ